MVVTALLKLFGDVPSFRDPLVENWSTVWSTSSVLGLGHRYKAALLVAYSSSPCKMFSSCKKDYTVLSISVILLIKAVGTVGNCIVLQFCGHWCFKGRYLFLFHLLCLLSFAVFHSIISKLHKEFRWILPTPWWDLSVKVFVRTNSARKIEKIRAQLKTSSCINLISLT